MWLLLFSSAFHAELAQHLAGGDSAPASAAFAESLPNGLDAQSLGAWLTFYGQPAEDQEDLDRTLEEIGGPGASLLDLAHEMGHRQRSSAGAGHFSQLSAACGDEARWKRFDQPPPQVGQRVAGPKLGVWQLDKCLSGGKFAEAWMATQRDDDGGSRTAVLKILRSPKYSTKDVEAECAFGKEVGKKAPQSYTRCFGVDLWTERKLAFSALELVPGKDVDSLLREKAIRIAKAPEDVRLVLDKDYRLLGAETVTCAGPAGCSTTPIAACGHPCSVTGEPRPADGATVFPATATSAALRVGDVVDGRRSPELFSVEDGPSPIFPGDGRITLNFGPAKGEELPRDLMLEDGPVVEHGRMRLPPAEGNHGVLRGPSLPIKTRWPPGVFSAEGLTLDGGLKVLVPAGALVVVPDQQLSLRVSAEIARQYLEGYVAVTTPATAEALDAGEDGQLYFHLDCATPNLIVDLEAVQANRPGLKLIDYGIVGRCSPACVSPSKQRHAQFTPRQRCPDDEDADPSAEPGCPEGCERLPVGRCWRTNKAPPPVDPHAAAKAHRRYQWIMLWRFAKALTTFLVGSPEHYTDPTKLGDWLRAQDAVEINGKPLYSPHKELLEPAARLFVEPGQDIDTPVAKGECGSEAYQRLIGQVLAKVDRRRGDPEPFRPLLTAVCDALYSEQAHGVVRWPPQRVRDELSGAIAKLDAAVRPAERGPRDDGDRDREADRDRDREADREPPARDVELDALQQDLQEAEAEAAKNQQRANEADAERRQVQEQLAAAEADLLKAHKAAAKQEQQAQEQREVEAKREQLAAQREALDGVRGALEAQKAVGRVLKEQLVAAAKAKEQTELQLAATRELKRKDRMLALYGVVAIASVALGYFVFFSRTRKPSDLGARHNDFGS